jgi:hypothetical protein
MTVSFRKGPAARASNDTSIISYNILFLLLFFNIHSHSIVPGGLEVTS